MVHFISPIRMKTIELQQDISSLQSIMKMGKEKARESASKVLDEARKKMGINYYC